MIEIGPHRVAEFPDLVGLVGLESMLGGAVLMGEDRDRLGAQLGGGPECTDRDLASVGDQDLLEHAARLSTDSARHQAVST